LDDGWDGRHPATYYSKPVDVLNQYSSHTNMPFVPANAETGKEKQTVKSYAHKVADDEIDIVTYEAEFSVPATSIASMHGVDTPHPTKQEGGARYTGGARYMGRGVHNEVRGQNLRDILTPGHQSARVDPTGGVNDP
jgi:hypothetical protein